MTPDQRIIIFEGPDRSGKTEIATELSRVTGIPYWKNSAEHDLFRMGGDEITKSAVYGIPFLGDFLKATGYSAIIDRSFPTEFAYSVALGRDVNVLAISKMDQLFSQMGAVIVYCTKRYESFEDEFIPFKKIEVIREAYEVFFRMTQCEVVRLDTTNENLAEQVEEIIESAGIL